MGGKSDLTGNNYLAEVNFAPIQLEATGLYEFTGYAFFDCEGQDEICDVSKDFIKLYFNHGVKPTDTDILQLNYLDFDSSVAWKPFTYRFNATTKTLKVIFY